MNPLPKQTIRFLVTIGLFSAGLILYYYGNNREPEAPPPKKIVPALAGSAK